MADKRISQLIERTDIANNDVLPIVASGATTTNKVTVSTLQDWMQDNLDVGVTSVGITLGTTGTNINVTGSPVTSSGNITINIPTASATNRGALSSTDWSTFNSKLSSVGLTMPSAFVVSNSPLTANGTIAVTGAGTVAQYIRGDGSLADFPEAGGGGASVSYYLNGSVSQGTIGGIAYYEMNKTPILGTGTDFVAIADGYLASFITDAGDPSLLEIPGGNWNFETYFSASSGGGSPSFYIELYKVSSGGTATLIASNSAVPELIAFGTTITPYFSTLAVPTTTLALTDRLALRYYVARSGRTITLHTENSHLCQIITTFTTGLTALNGLTAQVQNFATGTSGTDFNISSASSTHTFNLPDASASNRGVVTTGTQTFAGYKIFTGTIGANVDIQLATQGTALNTFIKNINATGQTSIGSNGFGFNNANNIYFSGSSKGGGIIAFSNTGNQTYTLQNASGTLAFTSDLNSYLPLTGGTLTGTLAGTAAVFSGSIDANNGTNSTNGIKVISSLSSSLFTGGIEFLRTTVTAGSKIEPIRDAALGGVGLRFLTTLNNSAESSGTLTTAMTIAPTGGVTLTGALNGTSASFGGTGTGNNVISISNNDQSNARLRITNTGSGGRIYSIVGGLNGANNSSFSIYDETAGSTRFEINSTGAATFSSSVTATQGVFNGSGSNDLLYLDAGINTDFAFKIVSGSNDVLTLRRQHSTLGNLDIISYGFNGNVGIGTASPLALLHVSGSSSGAVQAYIHNRNGATNSSAELVFGTYGGAIPTGGGNPGPSAKIVALNTNVSDASTDLTFHTYASTGSSAERMRITSSGTVGIGTSSPSSTYILDVHTNNSVYNTRFYQPSSSTSAYNSIIITGAMTSAIGYAGIGGSATGNTSFRDAFVVGTQSSHPLVFNTNDTERMRITSDGVLSMSNNASTFSIGSIANQKRIQFESGGFGFYNSSNAYAPTYASAFNVMSDYRLKEDLQDVNGLDKISQIKIYDFKWIGRDERQDGVLAHELAEVLPYAVNREKDEVNEEGDILPQGVDYSKIVPVLIKAIQELKVEIDSLKTK